MPVTSPMSEAMLPAMAVLEPMRANSAPVTPRTMGANNGPGGPHHVHDAPQPVLDLALAGPQVGQHLSKVEGDLAGIAGISLGAQRHGDIGVLEVGRGSPQAALRDKDLGRSLLPESREW